MIRRKRITAFVTALLMLITSGMMQMPMREVQASEEPAAEAVEDGGGETQTSEGNEVREKEQKQEEAGQNEEAASEAEAVPGQMVEKKEVSKQSVESVRNADAGVRVTGISLAEGEAIDLSAVKAPASYTAALRLDAPAGTEIMSVELDFRSEVTGLLLCYETTYADGLLAEEGFRPETANGICKADVEINKYAPIGKYQLENILITVKYEGSFGYCREGEDGQFVKRIWTDGTDTVVDEFTYNNSVDYTVAESLNDTVKPDVTSVRMLTQGNIYSSTDAEFEVGYSENEGGSGIKSISLNYMCHVDGMNYGDHYELTETPAEGACTGEGVLRLRGSRGGELGEYNLESVTIADYAGNARDYYLDSDSGELVSWNENGTKKVLEVTDRSYTVLPAKAPLEIRSVKVMPGNKNKDDLASGDSFEFETVVYNNTDADIRLNPQMCGASWQMGEMQEEYISGEGEALTIAAGEEAVLTFQKTISRYAVIGKRVLGSINFSGEGFDYYYNVWGGKLHGHDGQGGQSEGIPYNGELDFTVTSSEKPDGTVPDITYIKRLTTAEELYSSTPIEYEVGYTEEGSGIKEISMGFVNGEWGDYYEMKTQPAEEEYVGQGKIVLSSGNRAVGDYRLTDVRIMDYAENVALYNFENGKLVRYDNEGRRKELPVDERDSAYTVIQAKADLVVTSVRIADGVNKDDLAAGDNVDVEVTVQNQSQDRITFHPGSSSIAWLVDGMKSEASMGTGEQITIAPGGEQTIVFSHSINLFASQGKRELSAVDFHTAGKKSYFCYVANGYIVGQDGEGGNETYRNPYNGEADFTVTRAEQGDDEAPFVEGVSVLTKNIKAPGQAQIAVKLSEEGNAKVKNGMLSFVDVENPNNIISCSWDTNIFPAEYDENLQAYVCTCELWASIIKGTYRLQIVQITDEADNIRRYELAEDCLADWEGNTCQPCDLIVEESKETDTDFEPPVLSSFELMDAQVQAGKALRFRMDITDESPVRGIMINYRNKETGGMTTIENWDIASGKEGAVYSFTVDKYCKAGDYELEDVFLIDDSARMNAIRYYTSAGMLETEPLPGGGWYPAVEITGASDLRVEANEDFVVADTSIDKLEEIVQTVETGGTIVVKDAAASSGEAPVVLPEEFLETAKNNSLQIILPDIYSNSELVINGADLADTAGGLELSVYRDVISMEKLDENGTIEDNLYYPVLVEASDTTVPVTMRIKLDKEFMDSCGTNPIRVSKAEPDGSIVILQDNLAPDAEGYVELTFAGGLNGAVKSRSLRKSAARSGAGAGSSGNEELTFYISSVAQEEEYLLGDVNGDTKITPRDALLTLKHYTGTEIFTADWAEKAANVNGDAKITPRDALMILKYYTGSITEWETGK